MSSKNSDSLWLLIGLFIIAVVLAPASAVTGSKSNFGLYAGIFLVIAALIGIGVGIGYFVF